MPTTVLIATAVTLSAVRPVTFTSAPATKLAGSEATVAVTVEPEHVALPIGTVTDAVGLTAKVFAAAMVALGWPAALVHRANVTGFVATVPAFTARFFSVPPEVIGTPMVLAGVLLVTVPLHVVSHAAERPNSARL